MDCSSVRDISVSHRGIARVATYVIDGLDARLVWVEVDVRPGLPSFRIVGLGGAAVREARERVHAAVLNSGFEFPPDRITANFSRAFPPNAGSGMTVALAVALLAASAQCRPDMLSRWVISGELTLLGELRACRGTLAIAERARRDGFEGLIVAPESSAEAALVDRLDVAGLRDLQAIRELLAGGELPPRPQPDASRLAEPGPELDLCDVRGHDLPLRALEIAAAGSHHLLLDGPRGSGMLMLARRLPPLLPPLSDDEAREVTWIRSVAGVRTDGALIGERPFRAPHHTISPLGLVGGGRLPMLGEVTRAHGGVLLLDNLPEFSRPVLEALRQPIEDGHVAITRGERTLFFPSRFLLVATTDPRSPVLIGDHHDWPSGDLELYRRCQFTGPLLDRIDLRVPVSPPTADELRQPARTTSAAAQERVIAARERQAARAITTTVATNSQLDAGLLRAHVKVAASARKALADAQRHGAIGDRGRDRILRIARTIADLEDRDVVSLDDVIQARELV